MRYSRRSRSAKRLYSGVTITMYRVARASYSWIRRIMAAWQLLFRKQLMRKKTGAYYWFRWRSNLIFFDYTEELKIRCLPLKVRCGSFDARRAWHNSPFQRFGRRYRLFRRIKSWVSQNRIYWCRKAISTISTDKSWDRTYWCRTIVKLCSHKFRMSRLLHWYTPREEVGTAVCGRGRKVTTVNNKGGATCNSTKTITLIFARHKVFNCAILQPQNRCTQSLMLLSSSCKDFHPIIAAKS